MILAASQFNGGALSEAIDKFAFGLSDRYQQWFDKVLAGLSH
jgi:hypothetical protein